ncbi:thyroid hormone receptor alpha-like isoform X3 [Aphelocoma coerulescens]
MEQKPSTLDPLLEPEDTRWLDGKRKRKSSQCLVKSSMSGTPGSHGCLMSRPGPLEFHGHPLSPGTSLVTWTKMNSAWCAGTRPPATTTAASPGFFRRTIQKNLHPTYSCVIDKITRN